MAGSFGHVDPAGGGSWGMIENMGDAHECVEELLWLVLHFARRSAAIPGGTVGDVSGVVHLALNDVYYPMLRSERPEDDDLRAVRQAMEA